VLAIGKKTYTIKIVTIIKKTIMKLSKTNQRKVILEELRKLTSHPTADDLYEIVRKKLPQISLGTVYRNLEQMSQAGIIQKLELTGRQKRFDGNAEKHYHMRCKECGRVMDLDNNKFTEIESLLTDVLSELKCHEFRLEFDGTCTKCSN
jgi:Fe2+ or Zn2+ uptake regulation protein